MLYSEIIDSAFSKMFFNEQWTQSEYDVLTECANEKNIIKELSDLQNKAKELLDYERRFNYRHCRNVTRRFK